MSEKEKLELLEEIMDLDEGALALSDTLTDLDEWDSIAALSFIAMMDDKFSKTISGQDVKALVTVADALAIME